MMRNLNSIERAAADWLVRREAGLPPAEEARLAAWLEADADHAARYRALQQSWSRLDRLQGSKVGERLEAELDGLVAPKVNAWRSRAPRRIIPWVSGALAASIGWALAYFTWWRPAPARAPYAETAATAIGATRALELPDGSTIQLNTDTAIDVLFTKAERRVRLGRGEALFKIAKNQSRPFIVSAAGVDVRAVGTEFNVRLHSETLEVTVREGKVRVDDGSSGETLLARPAPASASTETAAAILAAGERVVIPVAAAEKFAALPAAPIGLSQVEIERSLAWQNGRLVFESAPLSEIVTELNRYNHRQLVIEDPALSARRFGGTFVANDPDTLIELLRATDDVAAEEQAGKIALRLKRGR